MVYIGNVKAGKKYHSELTKNFLNVNYKYYDNNFIKRATDFFGAKKVEMYKDFNNVIEVCKSRSTGVMDFLVGLYYEPESRRFKNYVAENIMYGWYETPIQQTITTPNNMVFSPPVITYENNDMPFEPGNDEKCPF